MYITAQLFNIFLRRDKTIKNIKIVVPNSLDTTYAKFLKIHLKNSKSYSYNIVTVGKSKSNLKKELLDADIVITISWNTKSPPAPKLKLIQIPAAGYDHIDFGAIPKNCKLCNVYEHEAPIAEYCLLAMLESEIKLSKSNIKFKSGDWSDSFSDHIFRGELLGRQLGVIGYGRIGKEIIKRAKVFEMQITAIVRDPNKYKGNSLSAIKLSSINNFKSIIKDFDYLIIACPLTNKTRELITLDIMKKMKSSSVIINIARGDIIKEKDLYTALKKNIIREAVIDVWYTYPNSNKIKNIWPSKFQIHKLDNVIITPHTSAWTEQMLNRRFKIISKNILNLLEGKKLINQLN